MSINAEEIKTALQHAIASDQLVLPTLPEIGLQVQEAANDPDTDINQLSNLLGNDAALTARIIRVANSPLVRGEQTISHLQAAISRLGIDYSCNLVMGLAMEQMFQATNEYIDERLREVWWHSTEVAAIATVLAQHYTNLAADQATLAGLTHLIGVLPILTYLEEHDVAISEADENELDSLIASLSPKIGEQILRTWNFPDELALVPLQHPDTMRNSEQADYTDIVIVAKLQSYGLQGEDADKLDLSQVPAFAKLGLSPEDNTFDLGELNEEITLASGALQ